MKPNIKVAAVAVGSLIKGSPCINTGLIQAWMTNAVDLGGHRRIENGLVDMGASEWFPKGTVLTIQ